MQIQIFQKISLKAGKLVRLVYYDQKIMFVLQSISMFLNYDAHQ